MRFFSISPENQQRLAVLVPLLALVLSLFVVYPAWGRYSDLKTQLADKREDLAKLKATPMPQPSLKMPAVPGLPSEPPQFLAHMNALAAASGARVTGFDLTAGGTGKAEAMGPVSAARANLEVTGTYVDIRRFLEQLATTDRLYVVTDVDVSSAKGAGAQGAGAQPVVAGPLTAKLTIERYVTAAAGTQPAGAPGP